MEKPGDDIQPDKKELKTLEIGGIYRLKPMQIGGYLYGVDYNDGNYIDVRVLKRLDQHGFFLVTTRGEDGEHLGIGGGWSGDSRLCIFPSQVEEVF